jgi:hypothetical protein
MSRLPTLIIVSVLMLFLLICNYSINAEIITTVITPPPPSVTFTVTTPTVPELTPRIHDVFYVRARDFTTESLAL